MTISGTSRPRLRVREDLLSFSWLVIVNGFVGALVGTERRIRPAIAEAEFRIAARTFILSFIVVFGLPEDLG